MGSRVRPRLLTHFCFISSFEKSESGGDELGKVDRRLRIIIHAPRRISSFKISRLEYYANWLSSGKNLGEETPGETIGHCF